jgi:hypothetical protein
VLLEAVKAEELGVIPYELQLDYDYWNYRTKSLVTLCMSHILTFCQMKSSRLYCQKMRKKKYLQVLP